MNLTLLFSCAVFVPVTAFNTQFRRTNAFGWRSFVSMSSQSAMDRLGFSASSSSSSRLSRAELNAALLLLEAENPTSRPAESKLVNGVWEVLASGISSPGLALYQAAKSLPQPIAEGLDLGSIQVTINSVQPRVKAECSIQGKVSVVAVAELEEPSIGEEAGNILVETANSVSVGSMQLPPIPANVKEKLKRELVVTYLDEDLMIVRDPLGSPEILRRKDMPIAGFSANVESDVPDNDDEGNDDDTTSESSSSEAEANN
jgi:hypothetical protein